MVANFDDSTKPGTHWVAIFAPNKDEVYYFDSFGDGEGVENITNFLEENFRLVTRQTLGIQNKNSIVCGYYTVYFIWMCAKRIPFRKITTVLAEMKNPDRFVVEFVNKVIKI